MGRGEIGLYAPVRGLVLLVLSVGLALMLLAGANPKSEIRNPKSTAVVRSGSGAILPVGGTLTLPVEAIGVQNLGAATVMVGYDPELLEVAGCRPNQVFDAGMCNPQFDRNADNVPDAVRFNVVSLAGLSAGEEPLKLVDITWAVVGRPEAGTVTTLGVQALTFSDAAANPIEVTTEDGQITVEAGGSTVFLPLVEVGD